MAIYLAEAATSSPVVAPDVSIGFDPGVPFLRGYPWLFDAEGPIGPVHDLVWT